MNAAGRRKLRLGLFLITSGHHVASWRMPEAYSGGLFEEYRQLAAMAEAAKLDMLFIADTLSSRLGNMDVARRTAHNFGASLFEPLTLLSALAASTRHIGLAGTASTSFTEPYNLARLFASLDHISGGRAAWNVVTTADAESARNFGLSVPTDHDARYRRAEEFVDVVRALWDSWGDDAIVRDQEAGIYLDPDALRFRGHEGPYLTVGGPLNIPRPPQGHPVLVQAGSSGPGRELAARIADVVFTATQTLDEATAFYADLKRRAASHGRKPDELLIMPGISVVVGETEAEAKAKLERLHAAIDSDIALMTLQNFMNDIDLSAFDPDALLPDLPLTEVNQSRQKLALDLARREKLTLRQLARRFAGTRGHWTVVGTPARIADEMERWFEAGGCDGFNLMPPLFPDLFRDFAEQVVPELQRRGLFRTDYEGATLRDHLGLARPDLQANPAGEAARIIENPVE